MNLQVCADSSFKQAGTLQERKASRLAEGLTAAHAAHDTTMSSQLLTPR